MAILSLLNSIDLILHQTAWPHIAVASTWLIHATAMKTSAIRCP
jgi:hypothetical protein